MTASIAIQTIHAAVPGRTRYKVAGLKRSVRLQLFFQEQLCAHPDVLKVSASRVTGNLLVAYNGPNTPQTIHQVIAHAMTDFISQGHVMGEPAMRPISVSPSHDEKKQPAKPNGDRTGDPPIHQAQAECQWHAMDRKSVLTFTQTHPIHGLSTDMVAARLLQFGPNQLPEAEPRSGWEILWGQLNSLPVYLLGAAAGISVMTGGVIDALVIAGVVVANAAIGYLTESKAEKTIHALKRLVRPSAEVIRDGQKETIAAQEVVVGDLLALKPGSYVAADCRILQASHLSIDESMLTGESMPVHKQAAVLRSAPNRTIALADRSNMAYMGTLVTGGQGLAVAVATGRHTEIGQLQVLMQDTRPPQTPIERQLGQLGDQVVVICLVVCGVVFGLGFLRGYGLVQMLRSAISLAASAVPEGLPAAATIGLALGVTRMREHHVLVRQLQAVETLGAIQTICLDKTGTITMNQMAVQTIYCDTCWIAPDTKVIQTSVPSVDAPLASALDQLLAVCALCNETKINGNGDDSLPKLYGSSTENALVQLALDAGLDVNQFKSAYPLIKVNHRSESRLFMSTLHQVKQDRRLLALKGSPPEVLDMCAYRMEMGQMVPLTESDRLTIDKANEQMAGDALRVLGFAYRYLEPDEHADIDHGLVFIGLVGMADPVRPGVKEMIAMFHRAGIQTVMITGDQSATAYSVARQLDLSHGAPLEILDSSALNAIDPDTLQALAGKAHVYARVSPAHKLKIVQALQAAGRVVAMTGDGINDGPALKAADIGIAMGRSGTDVARDVADIVLEEDDLEILARALGDGRTIYGNIRKSVHFFLSTNISEIMLMFTSMAFGMGFPLTVMQLLWINIISDIFPGLALAMEAPEPDVLEQPPRNSQAPIFNRPDFGRMVAESSAISGAALAAYGVGLARYGLGARAGALAFHTLTISQLLHAVSCRSQHTGLFSSNRLPPNPWLSLALVGSLALQALTIVVPPLRSLLGLTALGWSDLSIIGITSVLPLLANEATKSQGASQK